MVVTAGGSGLGGSDRDRAGTAVPWNEATFTDLIDDIVAESAPRAFAVVQVYGDRRDARIAAWGLAWEEQVEIVGVGGGARMCFRSLERACWILSRADDVSARLVWLS